MTGLKGRCIYVSYVPVLVEFKVVHKLSIWGPRTGVGNFLLTILFHYSQTRHYSLIFQGESVLKGKGGASIVDLKGRCILLSKRECIISSNILQSINPFISWVTHPSPCNPYLKSQPPPPSQLLQYIIYIEIIYLLCNDPWPSCSLLRSARTQNYLV